MTDEQLFEEWWKINKHRYSAQDRELCTDEIELLMGCWEFRSYVLDYRWDELKYTIHKEAKGILNWFRKAHRKI